MRSPLLNDGPEDAGPVKKTAYIISGWTSRIENLSTDMRSLLTQLLGEQAYTALPETTNGLASGDFGLLDTSLESMQIQLGILEAEFRKLNSLLAPASPPTLAGSSYDSHPKPRYTSSN